MASSVAVVILNYNGETYLNQFLPSVIQHSVDAKIIVADNASTDNSIELLTSRFPEVEVIQLKTNLGYAGGYNECLKQVKADYYVLLNSDVEVTPNWLDPLVDFLDNNPSYAACQPKIKDFHHKTKFEYAGASGGFIDFMGYPYCRGRIFDTLEVDAGQYNEPIDIFWSSGACMIIRAQLFNSVGGFDEDFFAHMEEIDLCWRIHSLGYRIKCIPQSEVFHVGGGTLSKGSTFKTYLNFRNGLYLLLKNLTSKKLLLKFPIRLILDWLAAIKFLLEGNGKHSLAVLKAHGSVMVNLFKMIGKREGISPAPKSTWIVYAYFFKKKRHFSDL